MKHYNIPIFLPELACPFRCVYCNQFSITGKQKLPDIQDVKEIIEKHLASFKEDERFVEVAFFGGNFTGLPVKMQDDFLKIVQPYLEKGVINGIRCSTRPDYIDENRVRILKNFGMKNIELGAQTTNDMILRKCGRGHTFKDIENASQIIVNEGITLGLQMMLGLPFDTFENDMQTARDIVRLGAKETRIYPCIVVKDTELEQLYKKGDYLPLTLNDAVEQSATLYEYFGENDVKVLRLGLHTSDDLNGAAFVAGPYHKNFAEMVFSRLWGRKFDKIDEKSDKIVIEVPENQLNHAIGYKGENKKRLQERYKHVVIRPSFRPTEGSGEISVEFAGDFSIPLRFTRNDVVIIASATMPAEAKESLSKMGSVTWLEPSDKAYPSISSHPDIFFFCKDERHCESVICAKNVDIDLPENIKVANGGKSVGNAYPATVPYNAVGVGNMLIHNLKYTDEKIIELYGKISTKSVQLNVNQGYTRCNLLALDERNFITSDFGIKRVLEENGCNVFYVDPHQIALPGHDHGFFSGCCGLVDDCVVVCGSLNKLKECKELKKFIRRNGMKIIELYNGDLIDVGSIFFIRNQKN
ncbi:MAG: radical SAM protein [Bacteroidales bacterium]|nr:radical SAM protein [Bacteroidales bacterium]